MFLPESREEISQFVLFKFFESRNTRCPDETLTDMLPDMNLSHHTVNHSANFFIKNLIDFALYDV
jgi:hypothetical protein